MSNELDKLPEKLTKAFIYSADYDSHENFLLESGANSQLAADHPIYSQALERIRVLDEESHAYKLAADLMRGQLIRSEERADKAEQERDELYEVFGIVKKINPVEEH